MGPRSDAYLALIKAWQLHPDFSPARASAYARDFYGARDMEIKEVIEQAYRDSHNGERMPEQPL